jgi:bacteriocin-like protein
MRELSDKELDQVNGGAITKENGGGMTPKGEAFGVPSKNPADKEPPGQNKGPPPV